MTPSMDGGSPTRISRQAGVIKSLAVDTVLADTVEVDLRQSAGGTIHMKAVTSLTSLTVHAAVESGGTFQPLYDKAGVAVVIAVAQAKNYELPSAIFGCAFIKFVGNVDDTLDLALKG